MPNVLTPNARQQFFDNNGNPLVGGKLFTYAAGTTTKLATTVSASGANNTNPIILDFRGEASVWIPPNVAYKFVLAPSTDIDPPTHAIWTVDQIVNSQLITLYGGQDTGSVNNYVLTFTANFSAYADGIVIYWIPANTNTGASTLNVNGLGAVAIVDSNGSPLQAGAIVAGQVTSVMYIGGKFTLTSTSFTSGSFTGTLSTFAGPVSGTIFYRKTNGLVSLWTTGAISGVSSANDLSMSGLPAVIRPSVATTVACTAIDNGNASMAATAVVQTGGTIVFSIAKTNLVANFVQYSPGSFTPAGTKGLQAGWSVTYPL